MQSKARTIVIIGVWLLAAGWIGGIDAARAEDTPRFFHSGNGRLKLSNPKSGASFSGVYRPGVSQYDPAALVSIRKIFDDPADDPLAELSLRLTEFIDFLEEATASLHQYGMAADIKIQGVDSARVWRYVRKLGFGGTGYYHSDMVHVDVGPARSWDETNSGVGTDISIDNKLIGIVTDFDAYPPGDTLVLRFIRMTAFPIGVTPEFALESIGEGGSSELMTTFTPAFAMPVQTPCPTFANIGEMMNIRYKLPAALPPGRYVIRASFCDKTWEAMPDQIVSPVFQLVGPSRSKLEG
ncbi:MAG: DUF882 domain-containing protein [Desulfatitalea sp.]|nr:DUF882 domain-containing protein [Desulfatitalea sp.]